MSDETACEHEHAGFCTSCDRERLLRRAENLGHDYRVERDEARSHLETATAENERLRAELEASEVAGLYAHRTMNQHAAALETARKALEAVRAGDYDSVQQAQEIAGAALRALDTPVAARPCHEPSCVHVIARVEHSHDTARGT